MPLAGSMPNTASTTLLHAGLHVIERADIHVAGAALAEIGEPQPALLVEHQIVRPLQRMLAAFVEQGLDLAGSQIDALDRAADIFRRARRPRHHGAARGDPAEAAIVADVAFAVGPERRAIGAAGNFRDDLLAPVGPDPRQPPAADFDQHHRAVRHRHRPFRKFQIGGENADVGHRNPPGFFRCRADSRRSRTRNNSLRDVMAKSTLDCKAADRNA